VSLSEQGWRIPENHPLGGPAQTVSGASRDRRVEWHHDDQRLIPLSGVYSGGVAMAAALASLIFDVGGLPERLANVLFFVCLLAIWLAASWRLSGRPCSKQEPNAGRASEDLPSPQSGE
jgi:hypothetical protein